MNEHLAGYLRWLKDEGQSPATILKYRYNVAAFSRWMTKHHPDQHLTKGVLREFGCFLKERGLRPATQSGYAAALSNLFAYLRDVKDIPGLPDASAIEPDPEDEPERLCPVGPEVQAMIRAAEKMPAHTVRAAYTRGRALTLVALACLAGLRRKEIIGLELADIVGGKIRIRGTRSKGRRGRPVPIGDELHVILEEWQRTRERWCLAHGYQTQVLIPTRMGKPLSENGFGLIWADVRARAGIVRDITPHGGRHWFATEVAASVGLVETQAALGHAHLATTEKYLHSDPNKLRTGIQAVGKASREEPPAAPYEAPNPTPPPPNKRLRRGPGERRMR